MDFFQRNVMDDQETPSSFPFPRQENDQTQYVITSIYEKYNGVIDFATAFEAEQLKNETQNESKKTQKTISLLEKTCKRHIKDIRTLGQNGKGTYTRQRSTWKNMTRPNHRIQISNIKLSKKKKISDKLRTEIKQSGKQEEEKERVGWLVQALTENQKRTDDLLKMLNQYTIEENAKLELEVNKIRSEV